ncbi:MAG: type IV secretion system protein VirB10 [Acidiphilium sp.]|nr:type IV secretion system protein VirB10 [Acidiphilium sp.]MDD4937158.1 type IV secretion system protein VirB10 [Acidiphilium sp.]
MSGKRNDKEIDVAEEVAGARGAMSDEAGTTRRTPGVRLFMIVVLVVAAVIGGVLTWEAWQHSHAEKAQANGPAPMIANTLPPFKPYVPAAETPAAPASAASVPAPVTPPVNTTAENTGPKKPTPAELLAQQRLGGGFTGSETGGMQGAGGAATAPAGAGGPAGTSPLERQLQPLKLRPASASMLADRNFLITRGTMIDCGQQSKLVTDQLGMVTCYTTSDTYSANGHVVLIDAGSKITGSYQQGIVQGQKRVFVAWQRIETPEGVVIDLDSPGTGPLGAAGEPGYVDTHFWQRFGGAIMLSIIGDVGQSAIAAAQRGQNTVVTLGNTQNTTNEMATEALRNTINIPPTLYKNQGDRVSIFVARDLDFSSVYSLK